jgi:hypothetical protein
VEAGGERLQLFRLGFGGVIGKAVTIYGAGSRGMRRANLHQRPREAGSRAGTRCIAQKRPRAGDEARIEA